MERLKEFYSIGPEYANKLWNLLVSKKIVDPKRNYTHAELRRILARKSIFADLPIATQTDVVYNPLRTIPRIIIDLLNDELNKYAKNIKFDIAGSYLRKRPFSGDIDFVISKGNYNDVWNTFMEQINKGNIVKIMEPFAKGEGKVASLFKIQIESLIKNNIELKRLTKTGYVYVKVDAFLAEPDEYIFALLYATGSGKFNVRMRATAKRKGYLLNQKGLYKKNEDILELIPIKDEKEIFEILGIAYKSPEKRIQ